MNRLIMEKTFEHAMVSEREILKAILDLQSCAYYLLRDGRKELKEAIDAHVVDLVKLQYQIRTLKDVEVIQGTDKGYGS